MHLQGTLTAADSHHYIAHKFEVPPGATRLDIDYQYQPKRIGSYGNLLTLSLFDPYSERGTGHRGQPTQHITLSASEATPGYVAGALPPGTWNVLINCNLINPGAAVDYTFDIEISSEPQPAAPPPFTRGTTAPRGAGWYRGDLHGHTVHSDGNWDVEGLLGFARQNKLDFVTLTDHNTLSALPKMDSLSSDDLLTMGGFELTTFYGHALALGIRQIIDWRVRNGRTITDMRAEVEALGGLFIIAHPGCPGDPGCTGCHWEYQDMMPGSAQMVEIWNEYYTSGSNNEGAVEIWYQWLNAGHHLYATVGSDIHGTPDPAHEFGFNVVYAQELSEQAILDGVRHGHSYLSSGPTLALSGKAASGATAMLGDALPNERCEFSAQWSNLRAGDRLRWMVDGQVIEESTPDAEGIRTWTVDGGAHWCVIEVRAATGDLRAVTNPIFIGR